VVRCAVGEEFFAAAEPIAPGSQTLLCVGRLAPQKGQHVLLEALARLRVEGVSARLILAGDGELRSALEQAIVDCDLAGQVTITGWVDEDEVRRLLRGARTLVLPSFAEGLPVVIMEALAMQRPVVATWVAGVPELVIPGANGWLVPAGNVDELAAAIRAALAEPPQRLDSMGRSGANRVRERHDSRTEAAVLAALLAGTRAAAGRSDH
jgi:glycosyltransferase involved in cell wall biosynthesis